MIQPSQGRRDFGQLHPELQRAANELKALSPLLTELEPPVNARQRDLTRTAGTRCLVALQRWQLDHTGQPPPDLLTAVKAAGIDRVPIDEYSRTGEPLRFTTLDGEFVVYSVAQDGEDDGGEIDWKFGQSPGDWIFRVPPLP